MTNKTKLEKFWGTKIGKKIRSFGGWCIANGVIVGILSILMFVFLVMNYSDLTEIGILNLFLMPVQLIVSLYCLYVGVGIRKNSYTPQQLSTHTTIILLGLIIECILLFIGGTMAGVTKIGVGILNLAVFVDCIKYKVEWHRQYLEACGETAQNKEEADFPKLNKQADASGPEKHTEEYEDEML